MAQNISFTAQSKTPSIKVLQLKNQDKCSNSQTQSRFPELSNLSPAE